MTRRLANIIDDYSIPLRGVCAAILLLTVVPYARAESRALPEPMCASEAVEFSGSAPDFIADASTVRDTINGILAQNERKETVVPDATPVDLGPVNHGVSLTFEVSNETDAVGFATLVRFEATTVRVSLFAANSTEDEKLACHVRFFGLARVFPPYWNSF